MTSSTEKPLKKGKKTKIEIKKRETKEQRAFAFSKRRQTLFSKSANLCDFTGDKIAIFAPSPSENSDAISSFPDHSTALEIARHFLNDNNNTPPPPSTSQSKLGLGDRMMEEKRQTIARIEESSQQQFAFAAPSSSSYLDQQEENLSHVYTSGKQQEEDKEQQQQMISCLTPPALTQETEEELDIFNLDQSFWDNFDECFPSPLTQETQENIDDDANYDDEKSFWNDLYEKTCLVSITTTSVSVTTKNQIT